MSFIECGPSNQSVDKGFDDRYGLTCNLGFSQPVQSLQPRPSTRSRPSAPGSSAQRVRGHTQSINGIFQQ